MRSGIRIALGATLLAAHLALAGAAAAEVPAPQPATPAGTETAIFAMGCFWCAETAFEGFPGVLSVVSGFCGGPEKNPSYEQVSSGTTGHAESVQIVFDPKRVTYAQLLDLFWHNIDPTARDAQFCDHGHQYRSAIFYLNPEQQKLAAASKHQLETTPQKWSGKIATEIVAATTFWPAEEYHQDFYKKSPMRYESYRLGCGRDAKLEKLWGQPGRQGHE